MMWSAAGCAPTHAIRWPAGACGGWRRSCAACPCPERARTGVRAGSLGSQPSRTRVAGERGFRSPIGRPTLMTWGKRLCRNVKARPGGADDQGIMGASARGEAALARSHRPWKHCCSVRAASSGWMSWSRTSAPPSRSTERSCSRTCDRPTVGCGWIWSGSGTPTASVRSSRTPATTSTRTPRLLPCASTSTARGSRSSVSSATFPNRSAPCSRPRTSCPWPRCRSWWDRNGGASWGSTTAPRDGSGTRWTWRRLWTTAQALGTMLQRDLDEETRRFSEDQFRSMVEEGPAVVYIDGPDEGASSIYISPQIERVLGYTPRRVVRRPRPVGQGAAPRRPLAGPRRERTPQRNRRPVRDGVPHVPQGRARGVGARRGHDGPRRPRGAPVLPRRDDGHLRAQARRRGRGVPRLPRRTHRACRAARCSRSC